MQFRKSNSDANNKSLVIKDENGDSRLIPSITLYDIDYAILWQLQNGFQLKIEQDGEMIDVPVMMSSPEKWVQIQRHGGVLRGADNKLLAPLIILKRLSMVENEQFKFNSVSEKMIYLPPKQTADKFNNINNTWNTNKSYEYLVTTIPVNVIVEYDLLIWCNSMIHLNHVCEQIIHKDQELWGDQFQFTTDVGQFQFETVNNSGDDRIVKANVPLTVQGFIRNEFTANEADVKKAFTIKRVDFKNEWEEPDFTVDYIPKNRIIGPSHLQIKPHMFNNDITE